MYEQRTAFIFCALHSKKDRRRAVFFHANRFQGQASGGGQATSMGLPARSFYVGKELEPKDISAKFENGILTLHLPKAEAKKLEPKQTLIEIE